jgi:branched-chain amino acid transport system substrate-binding protein
MPLTSAVASTAAQYLNGIKAAIDAANAAGGVHGRKINLVVKDDGFEVARTISNLRQEAATDGAVAFTGVFSTDSAVAVLPIVNSLKTAMVGSLAYSDQLYIPTQPYFFALTPGYTAIYKDLASYVLSQLHGKRIVAVLNPGAAGADTMSGLNAAASAAGASVVGNATVTPGQASYLGTLQRLNADHPEVLVTSVSSPDTATVVKEWAQIGGTKTIIAGVSGGDAGFVKLAGAAANDVYGMVTQATGAQAPGWSAYMQAMSSYGGGTPATASFAESGYVAGQTLIDALSHVSGAITAASVEAALQSGTTFSTLAGPVTFSSSNHLGLAKLLITKVVNGQVALTGTTEPVS